MQGVVGREVANLAAAALHDSFSATEAEGKRARARLLSSAGGPASAWLFQTPSAPSLRLSDFAFVVNGRQRLGLGAPTDVPALPCGGERCSELRQSAPDHPQSCTEVAHERWVRHQFKASAWRATARSAGCATSGEPHYARLATTAAGRDAAGLRRGDIVIDMMDGRVVVVDVTVSHPAAASHVDAAARSAGATARKREVEKKREWAAVGDGSGYEFRPLAAESFGRLGPESMSLLSEFGDMASAGGLVSKAAFVKSALTRISCAVARGNALVYGGATRKAVRAAGRGFLPGLQVPLQDVALL